MHKSTIVKLSVVPNPYSAFDHNGRACAVVMREGTNDQWLGAQPNAEATARTGKRCFTFAPDPITVPFSAYYLRRIKDRELLPADEMTAKLARQEFENPQQVLARMRGDAPDAFEATTVSNNL